MAAEKDKTIEQIVGRLFVSDGSWERAAAKRVANESWDAARAEGIREAIQKGKAQANRQNTHAHDGASCLYCELEEAIRSLPRKQEEPR